MTLLIIKIATIGLLVIGFCLFVVAIFLVHKVINLLRQEPKPSIEKFAEGLSNTEFIRKIHENFVLIPRSEARALARAITQANSAGYNITNRIDNADLRNSLTNISALYEPLNEPIETSVEYSQKEIHHA